MGVSALNIPEDTLARDERFRLLRISEELRVIAEQFRNAAPVGADDGPAALPATRPRGVARDTRVIATLARTLYAARRMRAKLFGEPDLFAEPAWDILLDLYTAHCEGKLLPVTSACIGASVPVTTALRWLNILENKGLILRENDPNDARRTYVRISPLGMARMERVLAEFDQMLRLSGRGL